MVNNHEGYFIYNEVFFEISGDSFSKFQPRPLPHFKKQNYENCTVYSLFVGNFDNLTTKWGWGRCNRRRAHMSQNILVVFSLQNGEKSSKIILNG